MKISTATQPGTTDRKNEDFVIARGNTVVLLDGAGNPLGAEQGCHHSVTWFVQKLGTRILKHTTDHPATSLVTALGTAIEAVASEHQSTCDLSHPGSPSATVVVLRQSENTWQYLVLSDSTLMLDHGRYVEVVTDNREAKIGQRHRTEMDALPSGTPEHTTALRHYIETLRGYRNQPDGFWIASSDPTAAEHAITGHVDVTDTLNVALLSDGASRIVDRFALLTWQDVARLLRHQPPMVLLDRVREAEYSDPEGRRWPRGKVFDDATAVHVRPASSRSGADNSARTASSSRSSTQPTPRRV